MQNECAIFVYKYCRLCYTFNMEDKIELLAPAGNEESFLACINNGADAIYLGLNDFNARNNIENFSRESFVECVKKAHLCNVKVYVTLNTLIKNDEIEIVLDLVEFALNCGADAFIVQDVGLVYLLQKVFPGIELHASTQMGVHNLEGAKFIEQLGIKRVVLSRETPLEEIKRIKDGTNLEIEYFVQGALCVGFSGNCYLSSLLYNASGNRGKCKQLCRLKWSFEGKEGYLLSAKDFCMLPRLKQLAMAGVSSFKIEGRARRASYVKASVKTYRKVIDDNFNYNDENIKDLKRVFNRGDFTDGYFGEGPYIYPFAQNHIGYSIGKVLSFKKGKRFNEVILQTPHNLQKGDTIKFFEGKSEYETVSPVDIKRLSDDKFSFTTKANLKAGLQARLIVDGAFESSLNDVRKIEIDATFVALEGKKARLTLACQRINATVSGKEILKEAINQPLTREAVFKAISKGNEEFVIRNLDAALDNVFMQKSELNDLRRRALSILKEKLIKKNTPKIIERKSLPKIKINDEKNDKIILFFSDFDKLDNCKQKYDYLVYSPSIYNLQQIELFALKYKDKNIFLDMPLIAQNKDIIFLQNALKKYSNLGIYATNYYALNLAKDRPTIIGSELNVFNDYAVKFYNELGYNTIVSSKEYDVSKTLFHDIRKARLIYFKHCPFKEHFSSDCKHCKFKEGSYKLNNHTFLLKRKRVENCHFYLEGEAPKMQNIDGGKVIEI